MELSEYANIAQLEATHWWYVGMRAIAAQWVQALALPTPSHILDAGCGVGGGLQWLAQMGQPTGVDFHSAAVQFSHRLTPRVAQADVQALPFPPAHFDLVTSFEVLYHLAVADDARALGELARVLKPQGWLLVRVPAHDWLRGAHDQQVHTRHRYQAAELRTKLHAAGLRVVRLSSVGAWLFPLAVVRRLTENPHAAHTDVTLPAPWLNTLFTRAMRAEGAWLRRWNLPFGLSLLALAQKR